MVVANEHEIRRKYEALSPLMDERMRRCWAGVEADVLGEGGIAVVERATGMSRTTIRAGRDELRAGVEDVKVVPVRRTGGGRPRLEELDPALVTDLESLVEPVTRGDPQSPLLWTSKSTRKLAAELTERGKPISPQKVGQLLFALGYRLHAVQSNGYRSRLFKTELQRFADRTGLTIGVSHFPPGTSKWNKIEHRLFCHITENWRGRPLVDLETVVQLIGATRTTTGLRVKAKLDRRAFPIGIKVSDTELQKINLLAEDFHGDWNYTIAPRRAQS